MALELDNIQKTHPYLSLLKVANKEEYLGIVQNADQRLISLYNYNALPEALKKVFLNYGSVWWWESNRQLPINIFIGESFSIFRRYLVSFSIKETKVMFGPVVQLSDITNNKRIRRKTVQLVRRVN